MRVSRGLFLVAVLAASCAGSRALFAQAPVEAVHLVITGGPNAGTYDTTSTKGGCSAGATGPGSFGNQLSSATGDAKAFNSLQLIVPNAKAAAAGSPEFYVTVGFGPLMHRSAEYKIDTQASTAKKAGSGKVTVQDAGATAKVMIVGTTTDGVKIDATITCNSVTRM